MATGTTVGASGSTAIDALLYGTKWNATALTFGFPSVVGEVTDYVTPPDAADFAALTTTEEAAVRAALTEWSDVAGITFTESLAQSADMRIYRYDDGSNLTARVVAFPGATAEGGDIQLGAAVAGDFTPGRYQFFTLVHEIGHALGLKHPSQAANGFPAADADADGVPLSVMSYRSFIGGPTSGYTIAADSFPAGPMVDDIAAVQYLYGPNWAHNAGDTTYSFDPTAPVVLVALWDGGGVDTYNFASYTTALQVSLEPGAWTALDGQYAVLDTSGGGTFAAGNIANPYLYQGDTRSLIENATGGSGNDTIVGNVADNRLQGNAGTDSLTGGDGNDTLLGGDGADTLLGGAGDDSLDGGAGDDRLEGGAGSDILLGGDDSDTILGGDGPDSLNGGAGNDSLVGGDGADGLLGGLGDDTLEGGAGTDHLLGDAGADVLLGGDDNDTLEGGADADSLDGGAGADTLQGGDGDDTLVGGLGDDRLVAGAGADSLGGGEGADSLQGGGGDDTLTGGDGNDLFVFAAAGDGSDTVVDFTRGDVIRITGAALTGAPAAGDGTAVGAGGAQVGAVAGGVTTLYLDTDGVAGAADLVLRLTGSFTATDLAVAGTDFTFAPVPVPPDPTPAPTPGGGDTGQGGPGADLLTLQPGGGPVDAGEGDDSVTGSTGADTVSGGSGADQVAGGDGLDMIYGNIGSDLLYGNVGNDSLFGGQDGDTVFGGKDDDQVFGNLGDDSVAGNLGADMVYGNQGRDSVSGGEGADSVFGGKDDDQVFGEGGDDRVEGNLGADVVYGNQGNDSVFGGDGADTLFGGKDDDVLTGGAGADLLEGGFGADVFVFRSGDGADTVADFRFAEGDRLDFGGRGWTVAATDGGVLVTLDDGETIRLLGVAPGDPTAAWFV